MIYVIASNIRFGSGFAIVNGSYIIMNYTMNTIILRLQGEDALFFWSVIMMIYIVCDYAALSSCETSILLGGRYIGSGDTEGANLVYDQSIIFTTIWIVCILSAVFALPMVSLPLFGVVDQSIHSDLIPVLILATPFIAGSSIINIYLVRLVQHGSIVMYSVLSSIIFIAVPILFIIFHYILPGCEQYSFLILIPIYISIFIIGRKNIYKTQ